MIYVPQKITEFTYSNIPTLVELYDPAYNYALGELSRVGNYQYKSALANNLGNNPLDTLGIYWIEWNPSNIYAMLDLFADTKTEWTADGIVEFSITNIDTIGIGNFKASTITIEYLDNSNGVISGLTIATSADLNSTITSGLAYVNNVRIDFTDTAKLFTASKDTYVDLDDTGTLIYTEVANGDPAPVLTSPNQRIAKVVTDATSITSVIDLRTIINNVLETTTYAYSNNGNVYDEWSYGYGGFTDNTTSMVYLPIKRKGSYLRITFAQSGLNTYCGYLVGGNSTSMGCTLDQVSFPDKLLGSSTIPTANFKTAVLKTKFIRYLNEAKLIRNNIMLFIIDESENSSHNNMVLLGKITQVSGIGENSEYNFLSWEVQQNVIG